MAIIAKTNNKEKEKMTIKIDIVKMQHLKQKSVYNHNYYAWGNMGIELLQIFNEDYDTHDYYLIDGDKKVLLGSADGSTEEEIEFMYR